ncbi:MAG: hypothetical protein CMD98_06545 [Gammaproteobacteria bacterium]|nr:hypothetical protein [Gammaproteobacteria bacterium]|tara:strand:- start:3124 stop:3651 length:528 start_codon:yes stop_codon:yes gene_type:complete
MAQLGVDDFKAKLTGGGARANLYQVTLGFPAYVTADVEGASFMVKSAQLPGSTIGVIPVMFRGRQLQVAGDRTFEPWSITVINDTNFDVRNSFEEWMNGINQHNANTGLTAPSDYMADMEVAQLDKDGTKVKTYNIRGCFPTVLGPIEVSYEQEGTIEEFTVELQVTYWESDKTT